MIGQTVFRRFKESFKIWPKKCLTTRGNCFRKRDGTDVPVQDQGEPQTQKLGFHGIESV
jgi:hypothetical protein